MLGFKKLRWCSSAIIACKLDSLFNILYFHHSFDVHHHGFFFCFSCGVQLHHPSCVGDQLLGLVLFIVILYNVGKRYSHYVFFKIVHHYGRGPLSWYFLFWCIIMVVFFLLLLMFCYACAWCDACMVCMCVIVAFSYW